MQATFIKRTISRMFLCVGLAASVVACKKDKEPGTPGNPVAAKIAEYTHEDGYAKFEYNADGSVKKVIIKNDEATGGDEMDFTVTYDAQKRISKLENPFQTIEVTYENNVMKGATNSTGGQETTYTEYQYTNGNLTQADIYILGDGEVTDPSLSFRMTYNAQGLLTKTSTFMWNGGEDLAPAGSINYQYDGKTNPLYEHRQLLALFWLNVAKQNTTVEDHLDADQQPEDKFQYTYTYNSKGLPEKAVVKQGLPGGQQTEELVKYIYK